jgi:hypothetical protein
LRLTRSAIAFRGCGFDESREEVGGFEDFEIAFGVVVRFGTAVPFGGKACRSDQEL